VLISLPSQKPLDVQMNGDTMNITIDPETPNPPKQTILGTTTLLLSDGTQQKGLQVVQGEAAITNDEPNSTLGGLELSSDETLRGLVAESGPEGGSAGFKKASDGSGSVSAERGEVRITVRLKGSGAAPMMQAMTLPGFESAATYAITETMTITLKAGEVARFNTAGELDGVFLGSLSGTVGKTGDVRAMSAPGIVARYPATTIVFEGGNVPARIGMLFSDFMNQQLNGSFAVSQRDDGLMRARSANGEFYARAVRGIEVVAGAADGPTANADGTLSLTYGGFRSTYQPMVENAADLANYFAVTGGFMTEVLDNGLVQVSGGNADGRYFFVARPRHGLLAAPGATARGLTPTDPAGRSLFYTNDSGMQQQLDPAFHDEAQLRAAAAANGWTLTRSGYGGNNLLVQSPTGEVFRVIPDFRVDVLDADNELSGVLKREGERLYFYYGDEALRQGFTLHSE
jgi:hypothetical protein